LKVLLLIIFFYRNGLIAELPEMMTLTFCLGFGNQKDFLKLFEKLWKKLLLNSKKSKNLSKKSFIEEDIKNSVSF